MSKKVGLLLIVWYFSISLGFGANLSCNGHPLLCGQRYNEVSHLTAHNAQSSQKSWLFYLLPGSNINNQLESLDAQLNRGVRAMKMPVHGENGEAWVCHGMGHRVKELIQSNFCDFTLFLKNACRDWIENISPCSVDPAGRSLASALSILRNFLEKNPNEVLTLFLEDDANDLGAIHRAIASAQVGHHIHHQPVNQLWPTLGQMVQSSRRLVIFVNRDEDRFGRNVEEFGHVNYTRAFVWSSEYHFETISELERDLPPSKEHVEAHHGNKMFLLQHFVTPAIAGNPDASQVVNQYAFLKKRVEAYRQSLDTKPNFISVDFVEYPEVGPGPLELVNELNGIHKRLNGAITVGRSK